MKNSDSPPAIFRSDYIRMEETNPHKERTRYILRHHPEVKQWMRPYPLSIVYVIALVGTQVALGAWLVTMPWWLMPIVALAVGAVASHALFVLVHDAIHHLIFKNNAGTNLTAMFVSAGLGLPVGVSFGHFHLEHHMHMGEYDRDPDLPLAGEGRLVRNSPWLKALWLFFMGVVQSMRPLARPFRGFNAWMAADVVVTLTCNVLIYHFIGGYALAYMLLSSFLGLGLHPLGARWIQEHFVFKEGQATYSYYGVGNKIAFNVGYHNEHHDMMAIPWVYLPKLRETAPELYESLYAHHSWIKLYFRFIFDRKISLFDRIIKS